MSERTFEFQDGTSNKFWAISVSGDSHTVRFGKVGTNGQTKTKSFATAEKARADADKLIAEKTGKGYKETTGGAPAEAGTAPEPAVAPKAKTPKKKAHADAEETNDAPAATAPPPAAAAPASNGIDLSPEDYLWVTYGDRPRYDPPADSARAGKELLRKLQNRERLFNGHVGYWMSPNYTDTARLTAVPRLSAAEAEEARGLLRPHVGLSPVVTDMGEPLPPEFGLAALLGMYPEVEAVVAAWPDGYASAKNEFAAFYKAPERMVFGLGSRERVIYHGRRLKLPFALPDQIRGWLAHTGTDALDVVRDAILATTNKAEAEAKCRELARVKGPAAAPHMLELALSSKAGTVARAWLEQDDRRAAEGLAVAAAGKGKLADAAKEFLSTLKVKGQTDALRAALAAHPEAASALQGILSAEVKTYPNLDRDTMPTDLKAAVAELPKKVNLPDWISAATLPPILVNGARLTEADVAATLSAFRSHKEDARPPVAVALKKHADPRSRDAFAWAVYQAWSKAGFPPKDKWCFLTCGWLGGDNTARQLTPLIREWPGMSQHQRAKTGLEVLRAIGTDIALTMLNGIAQKLKFAALKARARELMDLIATDRGMTRAELEDRIVPDLDLDERGVRVFDYGLRQFELVIGPDFKPAVKLPDGKVKTGLPAPNAKDDAEKAKLAKADWSAFTKTLKGVLDLQRARLEQGMVTMRRWSVPDFETFLVKHPVMTHLVRRLVWGQYTSPTTVAATFRVTDEFEYTDTADKPMSLDPTLPVGLVHPMQLPAAVRAAWEQVFGDYAVIPPFPQLARPVHELEATEKAATELHRVDDIPVPSGKVWGFMEKRGWDRGSSSDHGVVMEFAKYYPAANVTAVVDIDPGIARGGLDMLSSDQKITGCYFLAGHYNPVAYHRPSGKMQLAAVDPVAMSETLADLYRLTAKE